MADYKLDYKLGTYHMVGKDAFEPQRTNNFELQIIGLNRYYWFDDTATGKGQENLPENVGQDLTLSINNFTAPNFDITPLEVAYANNKLKFAGVPNFGSGSIDFNDFLGIDTERILMSWFKEAYNVKSQAVGRASNYKRTAFLIEYDPSGESARVWQLNGCWLSSINLGSFAQDSNQVRKISCTFQYDNCYPIDSGMNSSYSSNWRT